MKQRNPFPALLAAALSMAVAACGRNDPAPVDANVAGNLAGGQAQAWPPAPTDGAQGDAGMLAAAPANAPQALPPLETGRLQPAQIIDQAGFAQPIVAAELQIPAGWQTVGGVTWNDGTDCIANQLQIGWTALAPDSLTAIEILPGFNGQVAGTELQTTPCPSAPYRSTREFLQATVQRTRPGARVLDYQDQPDVARKMAAAMPPNTQAQVRHDAGRLLIAYEKDGVDMREVLSAAVTFSQLQGNIVGGTATISSLRGPNGRLDFDLGRRIGETMRPNPQWMQAMQQRSQASLNRWNDGQRRSINDWHNRQMAIINARGAADRHAIRMRTNQEVAGIYNAIASNTSATNQRIHDRTIAGINEVNRYAGTDGSVVESSIHGGNRVFQNNDFPERAYNTNDPYHDPANATELEQIP